MRRLVSKEKKRTPRISGGFSDEAIERLSEENRLLPIGGLSQLPPSELRQLLSRLEEVALLEGYRDLPDVFKVPGDTQAEIDAKTNESDFISHRNQLQLGYGHDVMDYKAVGDNSADDSAAFITAIAAAAGGTLVIPSAPTAFKLSANVTVPAGVNVVFYEGGTVSVDNTYTFTINGTFQAGLYQIFSGAGSVSLAVGSCPHVIPQWWGGAGDDSTDNHAPIESAIAAAGNVGLVYIPAGTYRISDTIDNFPYGFGTTPTSAIKIQGAGSGLTVIKFTGASGYGLSIYNTDLDTITNFRACNDITVSDLQVTASSSSTGGGIDIPGGKRNLLERVVITAIDNSGGTAVRIRRRPYIQTESGMTNDTDRDFTSSGGGATEAYAIAFTTPSVLTAKVLKFTVRLGKTGSPAGTLTSSLYSDSSGPNAIIGGASATISASALSSDADGGDVEFTIAWSDAGSIAASTKYWIVLNTSGYTYSDGVTEIRLRVDAGDGGANNFATYSGSWATTADGSNNIVESGQDSAQFIALKSVTVQDSSKAAVALEVAHDSQAYLSDCNLFAVDVITANGDPTIRTVMCNIDANGGRPLNIAGGRTSWYQCYFEGSSGVATSSYIDGGSEHSFKSSNIGFVTWSAGTKVSFEDMQGPLYATSDDPTLVPKDELIKIYTSDSLDSWDTTPVTASDSDALTGTAVRLENQNDDIFLEWDSTVARQYKRLARGTYLLSIRVRDDGTPAASNFVVQPTHTNTSGPNRFSRTVIDVGATYKVYQTFLSIDSSLVNKRILVQFKNINANADIYISDVQLRYLGPDLRTTGSVSINTVASDADGARLSRQVFIGRQSGDEVSYLASIEASHDGSGDDEKARYEVRVNDGDDGFAPTLQTTTTGTFFKTERGRIVVASRYTTTQTLTATDHHVACDTDGRAFTVTLPAGVAGTEYRIANTGAAGNDLTIAPDGAELLIGVNSSFVLSDGEALHIVYETTEGWF